MLARVKNKSHLIVVYFEHEVIVYAPERIFYKITQTKLYSCSLLPPLASFQLSHQESLDSLTTCSSKSDTKMSGPPSFSERRFTVDQVCAIVDTDKEFSVPCFSGSDDDLSADKLDDLPASGDTEIR